MAIRAVVFDYGKVLTGPPDPAAHAELLRITTLSPETLEFHYWTDRHAYDEGRLTGLEYWQNFTHDANLTLTPAEIGELNDWDARMWTTENPPMLAWQLELKKRGILTAILSNMGDHVLANMLRQFDWFHRFDLLVWSYKLGVAKPAPAIYLHALKELGVEPQEALFLDDKQPNVAAAKALGMKALEFSTVERLRADLAAAGLDAELPMPQR